MSRKASSHLEAVADRDAFERASTPEHPAESGERSVCRRISRSVPAFGRHAAVDAKINVKISGCSELGIPPFGQTAKDGPPAFA
jgi:hypothetical protein